MGKRKTKRPKLEPLARIRRRLMKRWTAKVHELFGGRCAICGKVHGEVDPNTGRPSYMNAHHIEPRATCAALRYDPGNGILLCPGCHKFGRNAAHKSALWFVAWLMENRRAQYDYIFAHRDDVIDLDDRATLAKIEAGLK